MKDIASEVWMLVNIMKLHCYHSYRIIYKFITLIQVYSYSDKCWLKYFNNLSNCHYVYVHRSDKFKKLLFASFVFAMVLPNANSYVLYEVSEITT